MYTCYAAASSLWRFSINRQGKAVRHDVTGSHAGTLSLILQKPLK